MAESGGEEGALCLPREIQAIRSRAAENRRHGGGLGYAPAPGETVNVLHAIAKDVFMGSDDERNLLIFRRDRRGHVEALIERRKFNDLRLERKA
jgi:hypothetical protein